MRPDLDTLQADVEAEKPVVRGKPGGLSTFGGVFTPSILTILGVIMYLRFGWVVGNAGLLGTLLIVTISTGITFLTALSIAAIATDQRVRVGGAYYMISRSLGIEIGGAWAFRSTSRRASPWRSTRWGSWRASSTRSPRCRP